MQGNNFEEADLPDYVRDEVSVPYYDYKGIVQPDAASTIVPAEPDNPWVQPKRSGKMVLYTIIGIVVVLLVVLSGSYVTFVYYGNIQRGSISGKPALQQKAPNTPSDQVGFHTSACPFKHSDSIVEGVSLQCGFLTVPENRSQPGKQLIRLAVALFKGTDANADAEEPILYLNGGPGGPLLARLGASIDAQMLQTITLGHNLILFDQRGVGFSTPTLACPEITAQRSFNLDRSGTGHSVAVLKCRENLNAASIDLNMYTTIANAGDVHDLIHALGYQQVNLYGVSYGTLLALTVMRLFPHDVHAVVLDSTVPAQANLFNETPARMQHALDTLFRGCATNTNCKAAYPNLPTVFYKLVSDLNSQPAAFTDKASKHFNLSGDALANWIFQMMYVSDYLAILPEAITQISQGDYSLLKTHSNTLQLGSTSNSDDINFAVYHSIECGEDMAYTNLQTLAATVKILHPELQDGALGNLQTTYTECQLWGVQPVPAVQKQAVHSALPTLILSGEYDPITPPKNGELAMQSLSHSFFVLSPGLGHGVLYQASCPDGIVKTFLTHPTVAPDTSCTTTMPEPAFQ